MYQCSTLKSPYEVLLDYTSLQVSLYTYMYQCSTLKSPYEVLLDYTSLQVSLYTFKYQCATLKSPFEGPGRLYLTPGIIIHIQVPMCYIKESL